MGIFDTVLGIGGALLGGLSGSKKNSATQTTTTDPWKAQQPYLLGGFQGAASAYNDLKSSPYYQGDLYANMNPMQQQAISGTQNFATGMGADTAYNMLNTGNSLMGSSAGGMSNAANSLYGFNPGNATSQNISDAGQYADNPYLNAQIDAAGRDISRNLTEDVLPGLNRMGSATGNTNSSRTGIAEGIALRGAQDRFGDLSANMRSTAYQNGLQQAEQARQANMNARLTGLQNAGSLYGSGLGYGLDGASSGLTAGYNNMDALSKAGGLQQQDQQAQMNTDFFKWQGQDSRQFDLLKQYMGLVGGANYGSNTVESGNNGQGGFLNTVQGALGGASAGLGLYQDFKNLYK